MRKKDRYFQHRTYKYLEQSFILFIISLALFLLMINIVEGKEYTTKEICNIIYIIEGKEEANQQYGINPKYIKCNSKKECEKICINTVNNNKKRFQDQNEENDFLKFLARRYCPPNWKSWLSNLKYYLDKL